MVTAALSVFRSVMDDLATLVYITLTGARLMFASFAGPCSRINTNPYFMFYIPSIDN
jgi:hypothetical protein